MEHTRNKSGAIREYASRDSAESLIMRGTGEEALLRWPCW